MKFVPDIRPAIERDAPYLIDIDVKSYDHAWLDEDWALVWDDPDSSIFVATVYGQPIGFVVTEGEHIYKLAVKEKFRGNNVGKKLLAAAYNEAIRVAANTLSIAVPESMTREDNPRCCIQWLQKMGFSAIETIPEDMMIWGDKEDVIIFEFKIS